MKDIRGAFLLVLLLCGAGCLSNRTTSTEQAADSEIRSSFLRLKKALASGDGDGIARQLSPDTMQMFDRALAFGRNPDAARADELSQAEMYLGFKARWRIGSDDLKTISGRDLLEWGMKDEIVRIKRLTAVELHDLTINGDCATAHVATAGVVLTNIVLSFGRYNGKWLFDFDKLFFADEPQFAKARAALHVNKTEMAILILERANRQSLPALREFLLPPGLRQRIAGLKDADSARLLAVVISELSAGRQGDAETLLELLTGTRTNDQQLVFAEAVCARSRWNTGKSGRLFRRVFELDPATPEGNCARYMLDLDDRRNVKENMQALRLLSDNHSDNVLILWLRAIECHNHYKLTHETTYSHEAVDCYRRMLKVFDVGPVLLHQTFANVLAEELDLYDEGLAHRRIAVKLEPKSWTYEGLANTLSAMKKYDEANAAYAKLMELDPHDADYWRNWANCLSCQERYDESIEKSKKALECDPSCFQAYDKWGYCLESQGKIADALDKFNKAIALNPADAYAYKEAARNLNNMGKYSESIQLSSQAIAINPSNAVAYCIHGYSKNLLGRKDEALADYTRAVELDPNFALAHFNRGTQLEKLRRHSEALFEYNRAIELDPANASAYVGRGNILSGQEKYDEALANYNRCIELEPNEKWPYYNRGLTLIQLGKIEEAITNFTKAIEIDPKFGPGYFKRGYSLNKLHRYEESIADYTTVIKIHPKDPIPYSDRGTILNKLGKYPEAIADFTMAIEICSNYDIAYCGRGNAFAHLAKQQEADVNYAAAIEVSPARVIVRLILAEIHLCNGETDKCLAELQTTQAFVQKDADRLIISYLHLLAAETLKQDTGKLETEFAALLEKGNKSSWETDMLEKWLASDKLDAETRAFGMAVTRRLNEKKGAQVQRSAAPVAEKQGGG